jgi:hypothetical protein
MEAERRPANKSQVDRSRRALGSPVHGRWDSELGHLVVTLLSGLPG